MNLLDQELGMWNKLGTCFLGFLEDQWPGMQHGIVVIDLEKL